MHVCVCDRMFVLLHMCACALFWNAYSNVGRTVSSADKEARTLGTGYVLVMPSSYSTSTLVPEISLIVAE